MNDDPSAMPLGLARLWSGAGARDDVGVGLSVQRVVQAAIAVADADGLAKVSMARVAGELGFTTMSLYRHVSSKDELLELMMDVAAGSPPAWLRAGTSWRHSAEGWVRAITARYRQHPWLVDVPITGPPRGPHQLAWLEALLSILGAAGLPPGEALGVAMLLTTYVRAEATLAFQLARGRDGGTDDAADPIVGWALQVSRAIDADSHPRITELLSDPDLLTDDPADGAEELPVDDAHLAFGLARVLDGIAVLIAEQDD